MMVAGVAAIGVAAPAFAQLPPIPTVDLPVRADGAGAAGADRRLPEVPLPEVPPATAFRRRWRRRGSRTGGRLGASGGAARPLRGRLVLFGRRLLVVVRRRLVLAGPSRLDGPAGGVAGSARAAPRRAARPRSTAGAPRARSASASAAARDRRAGERLPRRPQHRAAPGADAARRRRAGPPRTRGSIARRLDISVKRVMRLERTGLRRLRLAGARLRAAGEHGRLRHRGAGTLDAAIEPAAGERSGSGGQSGGRGNDDPRSRRARRAAASTRPRTRLRRPPAAASPGSRRRTAPARAASAS